MRGTWVTQIKVATVWTADGTIYRPNDNLAFPVGSTQNKTVLANGNYAYITPSTKFRNEPIMFTWYFDDGTTKAKVEGYINAQNDVKIIDHNAIEYIGRFTSINITWVAGQDSDKYDIRASFERMPSLA